VNCASLLSFILILVSGLPSIGAELCLTTDPANLNNQTQNLCQIQCALGAAQFEPSRTFKPAKNCSSAKEQIENALAGEKLWQFAAGCGAGAWKAFLANLTDLLAPEEYQKFVYECQKSADCKRALARHLEVFRGRNPDKQYLMTDAEVDKAISKEQFNDLLTRSKKNQASTYEMCLRELGSITRRLSADFSEAERAQTSIVIKKRYDTLAAFDADCPELLDLGIDGSAQKPQLKRAIIDVKNRAARSSLAVIDQVEKWFQDLKISYQCYDDKTQGELLCYGLGKVFLDPLAVGTGGVFAARAIARAEGKIVARAVESVPKKDVLSDAPQPPLETKSFEPIRPPKFVDSADIKATDKKWREELDKMGVDYWPTMRNPTLEDRIRFGWSDTKVKPLTGATNPFYGRIYDIDKLPVPATKGSAFTKALQHPEMEDKLKWMKSLGYELVIDTSLPFTGAGAYFSPTKKVIALKPDSKWLDFIHEFQHLEFHEFIGAKRLKEMIGHRAAGKELRDVLPEKVQSEIGKDKIVKIQELIDRGVTPELAVNESLSANAELAAMGWKRYIPGSIGQPSYRYMLRHQITEIEKLGPAMTPQQKKYVESAKRKHQVSHYYDNLPFYGGVSALVGVPTATMVGTGAMIYFLEQKKIVDVYYDTEGNTIGRRRDGKLVYLRRD
jgi:hypothetical protein